MARAALRILFVSTIVAPLFVAWSCGGGGGSEFETEGQEFAEVIPGGDNLDLGIVPDDGSALTFEQPLVGEDSRVGQHLEGVLDRINAARRLVDPIIETLKSLDSKTVTIQGTTCHQWTHEDERAIWRMNSCRNQFDEYAYNLRIRPKDSVGDAAFKNVMGGVGVYFPRVDGRKQGAGIVGYNWDNLTAVIPGGPTGLVSYGYRAVNKYRHLIVATKNFQSVGGTQDIDSLYDFHHVRGFGGLIRFGFQADVLTDDGAGGFMQGNDGVDEFGRVALGWVALGKARMGSVLCGGSVGDGQCVYKRECYDADLTVAFESLQNEEAGLDIWEEQACPSDADLVVPDTDPPAEDVVAAPDAEGGEDTPGPAVPEPEENPELEAL